MGIEYKLNEMNDAVHKNTSNKARGLKNNSNIH